MATPTQHYNKWRIRWIDPQGVRRSEVHATFGEAKYWLARHESQAWEVTNAYRKPLVDGKTFSDLCDYWITNRLNQKRSGDSDRSMIEQHLRPAFGKVMLRDFGEALIDQYKSEHLEQTRKSLFNRLTLLSTMLKLAQRLRWMLEAPKVTKPKFSIYSASFSYLRSSDEIGRFLEAATAESEDAFGMYATAIYTGMRAGELAGLQWSDVNFGRRLILVARSYTGPTKGGEIRYVPVLDPLMPILMQLKSCAKTEYVFPNTHGKMHQASARIFQERFHAVLERAGFPNRAATGSRHRYIVFHDLRHTFASHWAMRGGDMFKLQKILGHKDIKMTLRYSHLSPDAFAADYGRLGGEMAFESNVVPLTQSKG